jgi:hypothetical protein
VSPDSFGFWSHLESDSALGVCFNLLPGVQCFECAGYGSRHCNLTCLFPNLWFDPSAHFGFISGVDLLVCVGHGGGLHYGGFCNLNLSPSLCLDPGAYSGLIFDVGSSHFNPSLVLNFIVWGGNLFIFFDFFSIGSGLFYAKTPN